MWVNDKPIDGGYRPTYMIVIHEIHVFELRSETDVYDSHSFERRSSSRKKGLKLEKGNKKKKLRESYTFKSLIL